MSLSSLCLGLPLITLCKTQFQSPCLFINGNSWFEFFSLSVSPRLFSSFLSTYSSPRRRPQTLVMPSFSVCLLYFNSTPVSFILLSFVPSLSPSLCSCALPVGVKLGECDRKGEAAGREIKGCRRREKIKGDNEKPDLGSWAPTNTILIWIRQNCLSITIDGQLQTRAGQPLCFAILVH